MEKEKFNSKKNKYSKRNKYSKKKRVYIAIALLIFTYTFAQLFLNFNTEKTEVISFNQFNQMVQNKEIKKVSINLKGNTFTVIDNNNKKYTTDNPKYDNFKKELLLKGVEVEELSEPFILKLLSSILPMIFFGFIIYYIYSKQGKLLTGNTSKQISNIPSVKFSDIAGLKEVKEDMKDMVDFLNRPEKYEENGAKLPKGAILYGPSGTGKTLLAKAIAGEAGVPFYSVSGSSFIEMFAGIGAKRVRELFNEARKNAPSINIY